MAFNKQTWVDRKTEYPDRRKCINVDTGVVTTYDISREEGHVLQDGTQLNAANFNDLEDRISSGFADTDSSIQSVSNIVDGLSTTVEDISTTVTNISGSVDTLSNTVGGLSTTVGTLSGTVDTLTTTVAGKQDALTAGTGISIENNVISISLIDADAQEY